jgi:hypothetical protein
MKRSIIVLLSITTAVHLAHAISLSDTWDKAKNKMYGAKESVSKKWDSLDETTKNAIIGASVATAATAVVAGAGYAGYNAYQNQPSSKNIVNDPTQSQETFDQLITFLSTDPNYTNRPDRQKSFLNRFDISDDQKSHLFDIVQYEEALKNR